MSAATANPYLPAAPADGKHQFGDHPTDLGGNRRCELCGAYRGSREGEATCRGEFRESSKMRSWAAQRWITDLLQQGGPLRDVKELLSRQPGPYREGGALYTGSRARLVVLSCGHERDLAFLDTDADPAVSVRAFDAMGYGSILTQVGCPACA